VFIVQRPEHAGHAMHTIIVGDLDTGSQPTTHIESTPSSQPHGPAKGPSITPRAMSLLLAPRVDVCLELYRRVDLRHLQL
jgi:hypothetical protein